MSSITKGEAKLILKVSSIAIVLFLLFAENSSGIFMGSSAVSAQAPQVQYGPALLSGKATNAKEPAISTSSDGRQVFVAWTQGGGGIYFASSNNGGATFSNPRKISTISGTAAFPVMVTADGYESVNPGDVYVAWSQTVSGRLQIFVAASTNNGSTFTVKQVSSGGGITPALAASGSAVYVSWNQNTPCPETALNPLNATSGLGVYGCDYVDVSTTSGTTWNAPVELNPTVGGEPQIVASGSYAYFVSDLQYFSSYNVTASNWYANATSPTGWTTPIQYYYYYAYDPSNSSVSCALSLSLSPGCFLSYGREPWVAASGLNVYVTFEALNLSSSKGIYSDYGITSNDGGQTWYPGTCNAESCPQGNMTSANLPAAINGPTQQAEFSISRSVSNAWEPENIALGTTAFETVHSLSNQGVYVTATNNSGATWSRPVQVNAGMKGQSAFAHIFTSDGVNVWVMWGQAASPGVWNAYVAYSSNGGASWSAPLDISNNAAGVAAGNQDVTQFWMSSIGASCYAAWTFTSDGQSQVMFAEVTG